MPRKDTYKNAKKTQSNPMFGEMFDSVVDKGSNLEEINASDTSDENSEEIDPVKEENNTTKESKDKKPEKKTSTKTTNKNTSTSKNKVNKKKLPFLTKKEEESVVRSIRIPKDLHEIIKSVTTKSNGEKIKGSKGFMKTCVTNGIIRELVELEILDEEYLENIIDYDDM